MSSSRKRLIAEQSQLLDLLLGQQFLVVGKVLVNLQFLKMLS